MFRFLIYIAVRAAIALTIAGSTGCYRRIATHAPDGTMVVRSEGRGMQHDAEFELTKGDLKAAYKVHDKIDPQVVEILKQIKPEELKSALTTLRGLGLFGSKPAATPAPTTPPAVPK